MALSAPHLLLPYHVLPPAQDRLHNPVLKASPSQPIPSLPFPSNPTALLLLSSTNHPRTRSQPTDTSSLFPTRPQSNPPSSNPPSSSSPPGFQSPARRPTAAANMLDGEKNSCLVDVVVLVLSLSWFTTSGTTSATSVSDCRGGRRQGGGGMGRWRRGAWDEWCAILMERQWRRSWRMVFSGLGRGVGFRRRYQIGGWPMPSE